MAASNDFDNKLDKALQYLADRGFYRELRDEQKSSLRQLYRGGDLLAVLPTGFGKSLIFQLLALMKKECVIIVVCPLKSICKDQIKEAVSMGITATSLAESLEDVANARFQLVFASAEEVLDKDFISLLKCESKPLHKNLAAIIVDECHIVETWTGKR
jgi:ATP-dependent DNA helicase RecQ